ncbi:TPA: hypothetical protein N0F65_001335 [Lagenidium giganteum]|uniref:PiggyBac transposable element-derived protein domain-containing protein n=1 Tax=Lagenidium giganteum TaxID=4803 RepID=A0AAV2YZK0_9STRA|nr:TPA: hypothetical protein N0F65_001335 [Lagenidium giganteum]
MSRDRYRDVARCLHFADNEGASASSDCYYKVNLLVDALNKTFSSSFAIGKAISFDEGTIRCFGSRVPAKMYNPMKPHK